MPEKKGDHSNIDPEAELWLSIAKDQFIDYVREIGMKKKAVSEDPEGQKSSFMNEEGLRRVDEVMSKKKINKESIEGGDT